MDKDEIRINKVIVHILDSVLPAPVLSDNEIEHGSEFSDFIRNHIYKVITSDDIRNCEFDKENSLVYSFVNGFMEDDFINTSKNIAEHLFKIMNSNIDIPPADLVVVLYTVHENKFLALLKMNYKSSYTHFAESDGLENTNEIIKHKALLPSDGQKLSEAVIVDFYDYSVRVLEKKYEIDGVKTYYLSTKFLQCKAKMSQKTKLSIVTKTVENINKKYYEDEFDKHLEAKSIINRELVENGEINITKVANEIFKENVDLKDEFNEEIEKYKIDDEVVIPQNKNTIRKFEKQMLTTDTGIEIKIPMEQYNNRENVEFITNPDGTISMIIKNINKIITK